MFTSNSYSQQSVDQFIALIALAGYRACHMVTDTLNDESNLCITVNSALDFCLDVIVQYENVEFDGSLSIFTSIIRGCEVEKFRDSFLICFPKITYSQN